MILVVFGSLKPCFSASHQGQMMVEFFNPSTSYKITTALPIRVYKSKIAMDKRLKTKKAGIYPAFNIKVTSWNYISSAPTEIIAQRKPI